MNQIYLRFRTTLATLLHLAKKILHKLTLTYVECDAFDETDVAVLVDCGQVDEPQIAQGGSLRVEGSVEVGAVGVGTANGPPG